MRFRPALLFVCTLMPILFADSSVRSEDQPKQADAPKKFSLEFTGKSRVIIPKLRYDGVDPITLEAWVKPYARDDDYIRASVVANLQLAGVGIHYSRAHWMAHFNEGRESNAGYVSTASNAKADIEKPVHVAAVYDGQSFKLYVNGKQQDYVGQATLPHVPSPYDFMIGADPNGKGKPHQFFKGVIDEVRISKVARYTGDFKPAKRFKPDKETLVLYHFDEGAGKIAHDASGNKYHAAIQGANWVKQITNEK